MRAEGGRALDGLVDALLRSAVRRWPPALREEQGREWTAELAALRDEPRAGLRRFTFALSLAMGPAPDDGSGLRGWRELLPGFGARLRPAAGFALLSLLVMHLMPVRFNAFGYVSEANHSLGNQLTDLSAPPNLPLGALLAWSVVPLCYLIGRRSKMAAANPVAEAGVVTIGAALGYLAYRTVPLLAFARPVLPQGYVAATLVFVALTTPLLAAVLYLARRQRWEAAFPLACLGLPVMAIVSWRVGVVASPGPDYDGMLFDPFTSIMGTRFDRGPFGLGEIVAEDSFVGALFLLGAMLTAYGFGLATRQRAGAAAPPPAPPQSADAAPSWTPTRATIAAGYVAVGVGLAAWVYATSALPPWAGGDAALAALVPASSHELRWAAVILAVLGVRIAAAHRRGATLAALLLGGWLLTAEAILARLSFMDDGSLPIGITSAVALTGGGLARWVSGPRAKLAGPTATAVRLALTVAAVVAAACGPLLVAQVDIRPDTAVSAGLRVAMGVLPATFVALAAFAAAGARRRPIRPVLAAGLAVGPVAVTAAGGVATTAAGIDQGVVLLIGAVSAGLFAVGAAALALAGQGRAARWRGWAVAALLAPFVVAPAALYAALVPAMLLQAIDGADPSPTTTSFQPGVLLVVLPAAAVLARWLLRDSKEPTALVPGQAPTVQPGVTDGSPPDVAPAGA